MFHLAHILDTERPTSYDQNRLCILCSCHCLLEPLDCPLLRSVARLRGSVVVGTSDEDGILEGYGGAAFEFLADRD